jgi:hypothetical protein
MVRFPTDDANFEGSETAQYGNQNGTKSTVDRMFASVSAGPGGAGDGNRTRVASLGSRFQAEHPFSKRQFRGHIG